MRQRHVDHRGVQHLHEGAEHHGNGDDPRIDRRLGIVWHYLTKTVGTTESPWRLTCSGSWPGLMRMRTGTRSTTFTYLPLALSDGTILKPTPGAWSMDSIAPA